MAGKALHILAAHASFELISSHAPLFSMDSRHWTSCCSSETAQRESAIGPAWCFLCLKLPFFRQFSYFTPSLPHCYSNATFSERPFLIILFVYKTATINPRPHFAVHHPACHYLTYHDLETEAIKKR